MLAAVRAEAQGPTDPHSVQPERPTVATHAGVVGRGWFEIETGLERDRLDGETALALPTVIKVGLTRRTQLNLGLPMAGPAGQSVGPGDLSVGLKWRLANDLPVLREFAVLPTLKFSTGSFAQGRGTSTTDASLLLISSRTIGQFSVDVNAGMTLRSGGGVRAPTFASLWTVSVGAEVRGPFGWVAELYGYPGTTGLAGSPAVVGFLTGPTYSVRPWLAFDTGIIAPVTGPQPWAVFAGTVVNAGRLWAAARAVRGLVPGGRKFPTHPSSLAGEWVDLKHATPADTSIWVLAPNGHDQTIRVTLTESGWTSVRKHYGRWRLDGDPAHPEGERLCFVHRPGRQGAACVAFTADTVMTAAGPRRRLVLHGYQGEHTSGDRELFQR